MASPGPPRVSRKITGNMLKVQMVESRTTVVETGRSPGSVTWRKRCQAVAPSISAASYCSEGIDCSPPSRATIMNGTPSQTLTAITENLAQAGSFSQGMPSIPAPPRILFSRPLFSL